MRLGLVIFVVINGGLIAVMSQDSFHATLGAAVTSTVQIGAMLGDLAVGHPMNVSGMVFRSYLLADTAFISLLVTQVVIFGLAGAALLVSLSTSRR